MFKVDFKNKPTNFPELASFAKKKKLDHELFLRQAYDQNVLLEENKDLLSSFIDCFKGKKNIQSQLYQDVFASFIIGDKFDKTFLEFGATDGFELSNSYLLENSLAWKGLLSEPSPQWHEDLRKNRKNTKIITKCIWKETGKKLDFFMSDFGELSTLNDFIESDIDSIPENTVERKKGGKIISVETISLNDVIKEYFNNKCPSYISIDTEGSEYEILNTFNLKKYRPVVLTIEHNYTKDESEIDKIMKINDYERVFKKLTAFDAWYVRNDILSGLI